MKTKKELIRAALIAGMLFLLPPILYAQPSVEMAESKYQFDPVPEGTHVAHSFSIKNTGDAPLHILKVNTG